jgi:nitrate/TMAO reductase-like tetraheme cytochrome c subunit
MKSSLIYFIILFFTFLNTAEVKAKSLRTLTTFHNSKESCIKCHTNNNTKNLELLTGEAIPRERVTEQCAQCHGVLAKNWKTGAHGKKEKSWTKDGIRLECISCHNPHTPKFPIMKADPPLKQHQFAIPKGQSHE